jgi:hypothetical protein
VLDPIFGSLDLKTIKIVKTAIRLSFVGDVTLFIASLPFFVSMVLGVVLYGNQQYNLAEPLTILLLIAACFITIQGFFKVAASVVLLIARVNTAHIIKLILSIFIVIGGALFIAGAALSLVGNLVSGQYVFLSATCVFFPIGFLNMINVGIESLIFRFDLATPRDKSKAIARIIGAIGILLNVTGYLVGAGLLTTFNTALSEAAYVILVVALFALMVGSAASSYGSFI